MAHIQEADLHLAAHREDDGRLASQILGTGRLRAEQAV